MTKKVVQRALLGFPLGVTIGYTITILISLGWAGGHYSAVVPGLVQQVGSEIGAVIVQYLLCGLLGAVSSAGSAIWENDEWSILKQTTVHFIMLTLTMLPIAWFAQWVSHTVWGVVVYFAIFAVIYALIWMFMFLYWKKRIQKINQKLQEKNQ